MNGRLRGEKGSVTIEATISLSAFMFAIVTLLTIVNICIVQTKVGVAINATAKELSHYSYLYSLTGIQESKRCIAKSAEGTEKQIDGTLSTINEVFTGIQNLAKEEKEEAGDIKAQLTSLKSGYEDIKTSGGALKSSLEELAKDPKGIAIGIAKIAAIEGWDLATSKLIAEPLSKCLCKKNLAPKKGGDIDGYLKFLGVRPDVNGSYFGGLDFSESSLFPGSSTEIRVNVSYDVKVIALLPIDFSFHFNQTAVTQGWLCGEGSYTTTKDALDGGNNDSGKTSATKSIWNSDGVHDRASLIRHQGIADYGDKGYGKVTGGSFSDIHVYSESENEFVVFHSMNPLYNPSDNDEPLTPNDINEKVVQEKIEQWCAGINDTASKLDKIKTRNMGKDGTSPPKEHDCKNNKQKVVLVIPEDEGLSEKIQSVIDKCNTRGVEVELVPAYGCVAAAVEAKTDEGEGGE